MTECRLYYSIGQRDMLAGIFAELRGIEANFEKAPEIFQRIAIQYKNAFGENPHVDWFLEQMKLKETKTPDAIPVN